MSGFERNGVRRGRAVRRRVLLLALLAAGILPSRAFAARPTVALLLSSSIPPFARAAEAIADTLKRDPLQPEILTFDLEGDVTKGAATLAEIHRAETGLVITVGSLATAVALDDPTPLPIVFSMVLYPEQSGFLGRPGRHVTGASLDVPPEVPFDYLKRLVPTIRRVGVLYSPEETGTVVEQARRAASAEGLVLVPQVVSEPSAAPTALERLAGQVDAVWTVADSHVFSPHTTSALFLEAVRHRTPIFGLSAAHVRAGALAAFSCDDEAVGRQSAGLAARVLHGEDPNALPVTRPDHVDLVLNVRVARHLGIDVPAEVEAEAGEVIR